MPQTYVAASTLVHRVVAPVPVLARYVGGDARVLPHPSRESSVVCCQGLSVRDGQRASKAMTQTLWSVTRPHARTTERRRLPIPHVQRRRRQSRETKPAGRRGYSDTVMFVGPDQTRGHVNHLLSPDSSQP